MAVSEADDTFPPPSLRLLRACKRDDGSGVGPSMVLRNMWCKLRNLLSDDCWNELDDEDAFRRADSCWSSSRKLDGSYRRPLQVTTNTEADAKQKVAE